MENKAHHQPSKLSYQFLKKITNNFDEERLLGSGTFGKVYKGVRGNGGEIAVKVLHNISGPDDRNFHKEFDNLRALQHPNIVELVGFCNESEEELVVFEGKKVAAESFRMALCFEYVHNGSLQKFIKDANEGFNWHTRYRIIKGICEGLKYLREGLEYPVMHFDLKPDNILLGKNMVPKIADFGLAKLFGEENTKKTMNSVGTCGYWPPEYIKHQIISKEFDIFSLGVIIVKIMTGHEGYTHIADMTTHKFIKHVHENWRKVLCQTLSQAALEVFSNQVRICIELALECLKSNRQERPTIQDIVSSLEETETMIGGLGLQIEQFYKEGDGEPNLSSKSSGNISDIISGPASSVHAGTSRPYRRAVKPGIIPLTLLRRITDNFSQERLIGRGKHAGVYTGIWKNGQVIAVKRFDSPVLGIEQFEDLVGLLAKLHDQNIIQFMGYCVDIQVTTRRYDGRLILGEIETRALCFEYLPNGNLRNYISEISYGLDWHTRYKIIMGICQGLRYLHTRRIVHLAINPSNIFLDENRTPKLADFGVYEHLIRDGAGVDSIGSLHSEYMPPEFINRQIITFKIDIYSLGVTIVEIMTGKKGCPDSEQVNEAWRKRLQKTVKGRLLKGYCNQVRICLDIGLDCTETDPSERPDIEHVLHMLAITQTSIHELVHSELLDVQPLELCFLPFMTSSLQQRNKQKAMISSSSCLLQLNNRGDDRVAFMLVSNNPKRYLTKKPLCGVVPPGCAYTLTLTMPTKQQQPPASSTSSDNGLDFFTLSSVMLGGYDLLDAGKDSIKYHDFFKNAKESTASARDDETVQEVMLKVICDQPAVQGTSSPPEPTRPSVEIIATPDAQQVSSIDVHPTEPWIMMTNQVGSLRVWNYHTMEMLNSFQSVAYKPVNAAKFIEREKWLLAGDRDGGILVYNYENEGLHSFDAHDSCITTLAGHPTSPFVLSSSEDDDHLIKLWDWDNGWKCTREFGGHSDRVTQLTFDPENNDNFSSASLDGTVKVWSICSEDHSKVITLKLNEHGLYVDYFTRNNRQHLIVGCTDRNAQIWELGMKERVHELEGHEDRISAVILHPELSVLITGSLDGTVRIWDSVTYKLESIISFNLGAVYAFGCIKGSRRIVVGCHQGIAMIEIHLP